MHGMYWVDRETEHSHPASRGDEFSRLYVLVALFQRLKEKIMGCKKPPRPKK